MVEDLIKMVTKNLIEALQRNDFDDKQIGIVKFFS